MNIKELKKHKVQVELELAQAQRVYDKNKTNHILHLILALVTVGVWGVLWLLIALTNLSKRNQAEKVMRDAHMHYQKLKSV